MTTPSNFPISLLPTTASTLLHEPTLDHGVHAFVAVDELRHAGRRPFGLFQEALSLSGVWWRRGRDSNPRYGYPYAAFRVRCFQPLSHLSVAARRKHPVGRRLC